MAIESKECFAALTEDGQLWEIYQAAQSGGGGGGAPTNASYVVISNDPTLTNERVLTQGSNITITDGGANNPVTVATVVDPTFDSVQIDTTPTAPVTPAVGKILWNDTDGTLEFGLKGGNVNLQVGQENVILVKNDEASPLTAGEVVYISGANGVNLLVKRAQADADATSASTIGIVSEAIAVNGQGFITTFGVVKNVNTNAFNDGDILYLSPTTAGATTNVKPSAPDHLVLVGFVQKKSAGAGEIFVEIQNGYELKELHDVEINTGTLANDDILTYNSATLTWQNKPRAGTKTLAVFNARDNQPPAAAFATLDTRNSIALLDFDDTTDESAIFLGIIPEATVLTSGLSIRLIWTATTATSGNCVWDASLERMTTDIDTDSFGAAASVTATTNATSGVPNYSTITLTTIDSVTTGDGFRLKINRDANNGSDTMVGDAELIAVEVRSAA